MENTSQELICPNSLLSFHTSKITSPNDGSLITIMPDPGTFDFNYEDYHGKDLSSEWFQDISFPAPVKSMFSMPSGPSTAPGFPTPTAASLTPDPARYSPVEESSSQSDSFSGEGPENSSTRCQNSRGDCVQVAIRILKSMHTTSSSCIMGTTHLDRPPAALDRPVDDILAANQTALQALESLQGCLVCRATPQLQLLTTAICAETIFWYHRIVRTYSHNIMYYPGDTTVFLSSNMAIRKQSISIGSHRLEDDLEAALVSQVLSSRLQDLDEFIRSRSRSNSAAIPPSTSEGGVGTYNGALLRGLHVRGDVFLGNLLSVVRGDLVSLGATSLMGRGEKLTSDQRSL